MEVHTGDPTPCTFKDLVPNVELFTYTPNKDPRRLVSPVSFRNPGFSGESHTETRCHM